MLPIRKPVIIEVSDTTKSPLAIHFVILGSPETVISVSPEEPGAHPKPSAEQISHAVHLQAIGLSEELPRRNYLEGIVCSNTFSECTFPSTLKKFASTQVKPITIQDTFSRRRGGNANGTKCFHPCWPSPLPVPRSILCWVKFYSDDR